jgi:hypothetical protein
LEVANVEGFAIIKVVFTILEAKLFAVADLRISVTLEFFGADNIVFVAVSFKNQADFRAVSLRKAGIDLAVASWVKNGCFLPIDKQVTVVG